MESKSERRSSNEFNTRRRSADFSDLSRDSGDGFASGVRRRESFANVEQVFVPNAEDASTWHHLPLAFAVIPAAVGLFYAEGTHVVTDAMLLGLASVYLHYLVRFPWEWYKTVQSKSIVGVDDVGDVEGEYVEKKSQEQTLAERELLRSESMAMALCFAAPLVGAGLLAWIRAGLSRPSEGLVSNFNITLFILAAELRPTMQVITLIRTRSWRLQEVVHAPPASRIERVFVRMDDMEALLQNFHNQLEQGRERDLVGEVRGDIGPDLEALNRAVRRYEKREAFTTSYTSTKMADLERRLNEMTALVGNLTARRNSASSIHALAAWMGSFMTAPFKLAAFLVTAPAKILGLSSGKPKNMAAHGRRRPVDRLAQVNEEGEHE